MTNLPEFACRRCGSEVEGARRCYAIPTCYACLTPPEPLAMCRHCVALLTPPPPTKETP